MNMIFLFIEMQLNNKKFTFIFNQSCLNCGKSLLLAMASSQKYLNGALHCTLYFLQKGTQISANLVASTRA